MSLSDATGAAGHRRTSGTLHAAANTPAGDRRRHARLAIAGLIVLLGVVGVMSLTVGATGTSLISVLSGLAGLSSQSDRAELIILEIRLPRTVLGMLVGGGLAMSGAVLQGLFRNPLADPGLVGVSAGAGLGAVSVIVLGNSLLAWMTGLLLSFALPVAAFCGGLATTVALYAISTRRGRTSVATMLLAGIALGAMAAAFTGVLVFISDDQQLRDLTFWTLGSLGGATWTKVAAAAPLIVLAMLAMPFIGSGLNALVLGEAEAHHLGTPVQALKRTAVVMVAASVGASVAVSGVIGFVGIVVPHLLRLLIGPDNRYLLPASALLGASLLLSADMISRTVVAPAELPIGIVTAVIGAPFFLWILLRRRGILDL